MAVDLHTHTLFSDGTLTPQQLIDKALELKLTAIAITDHDEIGANKEAANYAADKPINFVAGAEFSIDVALAGNAHLHILGLFLDVENDALNSVLNNLKTARAMRAKQIVDKLRDIELDVSMDELEMIVGEGSVGRPHIAHLLHQKKYVTSVWEAFNKYLSKGKPAYVSKKKLNLTEAIKLIHQAKGLAILAHPISLNHKTYRAAESYLKELKEAGLDGVEAYYASHTHNFTTFLLNAANRHNLLVSGGSDFHGHTKPDTQLGSGRGKLYVPDKVFADLKEAHNRG